MLATTAQNDMIITAYFAGSVYFLFVFREMRERKYLFLAALGICLALGTKASSFLMVPSVALIALYTVFRAQDKPLYRFSNVVFIAAFILLAGSLFVLPSGYLDNYRNFGNAITPGPAKFHSFQGKSVSYIAENGSKNLIRYCFDFIKLDGFPPIAPVGKIQTLIKHFPKKFVLWVGIDLENPEGMFWPFKYNKPPLANEDHSYWGILGFGLILPTVLFFLVGSKKPTDMKILSLASVLFFICQAFGGAYDPWRGRYFAACAVFAVPIIGYCLRAKNSIFRAYLFFVTLIGCASAISGVVFRTHGELISFAYHNKQIKSIFTMDRIEQLTRSDKVYRECFENFERLVPINAKVAVSLQPNKFEYPLFGKHLTRTIFPINSFSNGLQPIPEKAEYLLYDTKFLCINSDDIHLGADWYLRKLTEKNRSCP